MANGADLRYFLTGLYHRHTMPAMNPDELKDWRKSVGLTQVELAGHLGVEGLTVSRWERGDRAIPSFLPLALETIERNLKKPKRRGPSPPGEQAPRAP
jgi:transcriptional regulator with XRE-family HTH domain